MSAQVAAKISRPANAPRASAVGIELDIAQALIDLENNVPELKHELRPLQISAAKEVDVRGGKKAIVIFVPVPQLKAFHKVHARCVVLKRLSPIHFAPSSLLLMLR
jgi:small subunit ribosomal protein S7e